MNIVVLQDFLRSGGTERQSILLADGFASKGCATTLVTFRPGGKLAPTLAHSIHKVLQPTDFHLDWFAPGLIRQLKSIAPDIVLCMGRMANCYAGRIQRMLPRSAVVATMRTGKPLPFLFRRSLGEVRHIVANSREAADNLIKQYHLPESSLSVIPNALVFSPKADPSANETALNLRKRYSASANTFILLCVAMFRPEKNQRELIEIAANLPREIDWQLWLAGDGPALAECKELSNERSLENRVRFLGWHPNPRELYSTANAAVHASRSEALSNFLIEAQAHGLPVVAYNAQGNSECVLPGQTGFIILPNDRKAFSDAIVNLAQESTEARCRRSTLATNFARDSFSYHRQINAYLNLFREIAVSSAR